VSSVKFGAGKADLFLLPPLCNYSTVCVCVCVCVSSETVRHSDSKERRGEACVRHTVRQL